MAMAILDPWPAPPAHRPRRVLVVLVSSCAKYRDRRDAIRNTYARALAERLPGGLDAEAASRIVFRFLLGRATDPVAQAAVESEASERGDMLLTGVYDSYDNMFPKTIAGYRWAAQHYNCAYVAHADDDAFVRLERLLAELESGALPSAKLYWGYMWNLEHASAMQGGGARTRPIRDKAAKSYVPVEQWPEDDFPPFASGCCFVLSIDLVREFVRRSELRPPRPGALRLMRLLDVPIGVALAEETGVQYVHAECVRPYRPLPLYQPESIVQHYMRPEEFKSFFEKAYGRDSAHEPPTADVSGGDSPGSLYATLVACKVLRR